MCMKGIGASMCMCGIGVSYSILYSFYYYSFVWYILKSLNGVSVEPGLLNIHPSLVSVHTSKYRHFKTYFLSQIIT